MMIYILLHPVQENTMFIKKSVGKKISRFLGNEGVLEWHLSL